MQEVAVAVQADTDWAAMEPECRTVLLMGDFNLAEAGSRIEYAAPEEQRRVGSGGQHKRAWHHLWRNFAELSDSAPTH